MTRLILSFVTCTSLVASSACRQTADRGEAAPAVDVSQEPEPRERHIRFTGTVQSVGVLITDRSEERVAFDCPEETIIVDGVLSRWVVQVHIDSVHDENDWINPGAIIPFGVHSPTMLFWDDQGSPIAKAFEFTLTYQQTDSGAPKWCRLRASVK